jgi:membrane fusion protein
LPKLDINILHQLGSWLGDGMESLFRHEALEAKQKKWIGEIVIATPPNRWLVVLIALLAAVAMAMFLFLGHYTRREGVTGLLVPSNGLLNITSPVTGTVTHVLVHNGQMVNKDDPLIEVSSE